MVQDTHPIKGRRDVLKLLVGVWGALCAAPVLGMVLQYITPVAARGSLKESVLVGKEGDFASGSVKIVRVGKDPVLLIHTTGGQFRALSARCTHLGCVVQYQDSPTPHFGCNCHGSQFDMNGVNIAGPAPRPLPPYRVTLTGASIYLTKV
ncbi:MAG TPA: Rieske (2Fe-2S) protein [Bacteroidota bacterium]|nr:Rieske (2Fe-2S) protein [Bacteroidota bacterium]